MILLTERSRARNPNQVPQTGTFILDTSPVPVVPGFRSELLCNPRQYHRRTRLLHQNR